MDRDYTLAELAADDVPAVTDLCRAALDLPEDAAEAEAIVARLGTWAGGGADPDSAGATGPDGVGATGPDGVGVPGGVRRGVGFVARHGGSVTGVVLGSMSVQQPATGHVDLVAVHPDQRRQGLGRVLLGRIEEALAGLGARTVRLSGNPPCYAWPGIDVRYTPAICTALALGYRQDRTAWNMTVELTGPNADVLNTRDDERRLAAAGIEVRAAGSADLPALVEFARSTFSGAWDAEIVDSVRQPSGGCHVALRDGQVLGFAAYGSSRPSWFGPMGTAPAAGGLGIGATARGRSAGHASRCSS